MFYKLFYNTKFIKSKANNKKTIKIHNKEIFTRKYYKSIF